MPANIVLCVISTVMFCVCARITMALAHQRLKPAAVAGSRFSMRARRVAQTYALLAVSVLGLMALVGSIRFYLELFQA